MFFFKGNSPFSLPSPDLPNLLEAHATTAHDTTEAIERRLDEEAEASGPRGMLDEAEVTGVGDRSTSDSDLGDF